MSQRMLRFLGFWAIAAVTGIFANADAAQPSLTDDAAKKIIEAKFNNEICVELRLGKYEVLHDFAEGQAASRKNIIDRKALLMFQAIERLDLIKIRTLQDRTKGFTGWDDWHKLAVQGSAQTISVEATSKGQEFIKSGEQVMRLPQGNVRITKIARNDAITQGANEYRIVMFLYDASWDRNCREILRLAYNRHLSNKMKGKMLLAYDHFSSIWKVKAEDNANEAEDFYSANVDKAIRN